MDHFHCLRAWQYLVSSAHKLIYIWPIFHWNCSYGRLLTFKTLTNKLMSTSIKKLKEIPATAICGNDISSSCLYVSSLAIIYAGQYAWISLLAVAAVLFLFRKVYGEVVGALPLNGGAYNALLNTTSKSMASMAATLTILSYMATAVISASEAMH